MLLRTNVIFLYADSLRRDLSACFILQKALRAKGYKTFICSRRNFNLLLKFIVPRKLFIIGQVDMIYNQRIVEEAYKGNLEVHFMPAEGFAYDSEYVVMYPEKSDFDFLKAIYFWGRNSMNWFKQNRKIDDLEKLRRTGYTRLPIAEAYTKIISVNKKKIGFVGRFPALNDIYKRSVMSFYVTETSVENRYKTSARTEAESKAINAYIDLFEEIISQTDYTISLRPHPNENLDTYLPFIKKFGSRFEVDNVFDVAEWMSGCSKIVGLASSSFIDAYIVNVPVICLDAFLGSSKSTLQFDPALEWMYESCYLPETKDEILSLLVKPDLQPVATEKFIKLIDSDFRGDTSVVFDSILVNILKTPTSKGFEDSIIVGLIKMLDFILATRHYLKHNNALQFDYSYQYHPISLSLKSVTNIIYSHMISKNEIE